MKRFRYALLICVAAVGASVGTFAQTQPPPTPTPAAIEGFVPMSQAAPREELPATPLVFYAYAFVWVALVAYVFSIWRRMTRVEQDLAAIEKRLPQRPGGH